MPANFLFAVCQCGTERALKDEVLLAHADWRAAFARPGFVTFRLPDAPPSDVALASTFARTWGHSLGHVRGGDDDELARGAWQLLAARFGAQLARLEHLHVWPRERALPGDDGFDAQAAAPEAAAVVALLAARPVGEQPAPLAVNSVAGTGELIADCVLVAPGEWWVGWHSARAVETRWPGGVPPLSATPAMISRAYLKIQEALLWSGLPVGAGDRCVEIGSAPGGSCLALLERGCIVTGVDPAEMDAAVLAHPNFTHVRARSKEVKRGVFRNCRWLVIDANVAPNYMLDTLEGILTRDVQPDGLLLTLKLTNPALATKLPKLARRIRELGYRSVRLRQLAFNRQEVCAVAVEPAPRTAHGSRGPL